MFRFANTTILCKYISGSLCYEHNCIDTLCFVIRALAVSLY